MVTKWTVRGYNSRWEILDGRGEIIMEGLNSHLSYAHHVVSLHNAWVEHYSKFERHGK